MGFGLRLCLFVCMYIGVSIYPQERNYDHNKTQTRMVNRVLTASLNKNKCSHLLVESLSRSLPRPSSFDVEGSESEMWRSDFKFV